MKILAVGGGSGGHVTPIVAVVNELAKTESHLEVRFVCDTAFETQSRGIMARAVVPIMVSTITAGKFRRYAHLSKLQHLKEPSIVWRNLTDIFKVGIGFMQSVGLLLRFRPDVVFAKGGYVCLPLGLAARLLRYPLVIHDSDMRPGLTNRVLARFATSIATGSPLDNYPYDKSRSHYTGVPISDTFTPVDKATQRRYKVSIGVDPEARLLVATGGGLGAGTINRALVAAAPTLSKQGIAVYHVTGTGHYDAIAPQVAGIAQYQAVPFVYDNMHEVLGAADVVVSRASATFLQELAGLGKAVIAVPSHQLGDQIQNAKVYKAAQAAVVMTDDEIGQGELFETTIMRLMNDDSYRQQLGFALHDFARPEAARDLARLIKDAVK